MEKRRVVITGVRCFIEISFLGYNDHPDARVQWTAFFEMIIYYM